MEQVPLHVRGRTDVCPIAKHAVSRFWSREAHLYVSRLLHVGERQIVPDHLSCVETVALQEQALMST